MPNFRVSWMPDPDICRDDVDHFFGHSNPMEVFNHLRIHARYPRDLVWSFDGDGWSSQLVMWENEVGTFYISPF